MKIEDEQELEELTLVKKSGESNQERIRAHAILLSNDGKTAKELAEIFIVSQRTIFQWFADYKESGLSSLKITQGRGRKLLLYSDEHKEIIKKQIERYPHKPKKAYVYAMEELQLEISYETFKRFLKKYSI